MVESGVGLFAGHRTGGIILRGSLRDWTLTSVLHALHADERSGWLRVDDSDVFVLVDGEVVAANTADGDGITALQAVLLRADGTFTFQRGNPPPGPALAPMMSLILESARLSDEWRRLAPMLVEVRDPAKLAAITAPELREIAVWIDGRRTVAELVHLGSYPPARVIDALLAALQSKAIRSVARDHRLTQAPPHENFFVLLDMARDHIRAGELDDAEVAIHHALALRPGDRLARQNLRRLLSLTRGGPNSPPEQQP